MIDFGSSCYITDHLTSYVQSRSYRAPEVELGLGQGMGWGPDDTTAYPLPLPLQIYPYHDVLGMMEAVCQVVMH